MISIKELLASLDTFAYFDPTAKNQINMDASPHGLGAVMAQKQHHNNYQSVSYASSSLSQVEYQYSQIKQESLGTYFVTEQLEMYL